MSAAFLSKYELKGWLFIAAAMFLLVFLSFQWQKMNSSNHDDTKLNELKQIVLASPLFPDFTQRDIYYSSKPEQAGVFIYYNSTANFEEVRKFYLTALKEKGWVSNPENGQGLKFNKGEFEISIEHSLSANWNYSVNFGWHSKPPQF